MENLSENFSEFETSTRRKEEFYCDTAGGGCGKYFLTWLRKSMSGNYTIQCPNESCKHHHFRVITDGLVTTDRHNQRDGSKEVIIGLKATLQDAPWTDNPSFLRMQMKLYNGGKQ